MVVSLAERADLAAAPVGAEALRRVGDQPQPVRFRDVVDGIVIGGLAEQVDRDDADRSKTRAPRRLDAASRDAGSRLKVSPWTSTNTGAAPSKGNDLRGRGEGESGDQNCVSGPTPNAISASAKASVPLAQATACGAPQNAERLRLELGDLGTHDVLPVRENAGQGGIQSIFDPRLLAFQIDEPDLSRCVRASCRRGIDGTNSCQGGIHGTNSNGPMSMPCPCGRGARL